MTTLYFDNAATTKVRPEVIEEMMPFYDTYFANDSGPTTFHKEAKAYLNNYRERLAAIIGAKPQEIVFTSGATEANNALIKGFLVPRNNHSDHTLISKIEHESIVRPCQQMEKDGRELNLIHVDSNGFIDLEDLKLLFKPKTVLLSVMHGNNEIGTIQPIQEISDFIKDRNILFHTDAAQTLGKIPFNVETLGIDAASFSAHKIYGPKGIGAMFIREKFTLRPLLQGGNQELNLRAGTTNLPLIAGFVKASEIAIEQMQQTTQHLHTLANYLLENLLPIEGLWLNGPDDFSKRIPGNLSFSVEPANQEVLLEELDKKGIIVSSQSACCSDRQGLSRVLKATGIKDSGNIATIRVSMGKDSTIEECQFFVKHFKNALAQASPIKANH